MDKDSFVGELKKIIPEKSLLVTYTARRFMRPFMTDTLPEIAAMPMIDVLTLFVALQQEGTALTVDENITPQEMEDYLYSKAVAKKSPRLLELHANFCNGKPLPLELTEFERKPVVVRDIYSTLILRT